MDNIERAGIRARDLVRDSLNARRDGRNAVETSLHTALGELLGDVLSGPDANVHHSVAHIGLAFSLLASLYEGLDSCSLEPVEGFNCPACGQDFRGTQIKVTVASHGRREDEDGALALVTTLINSQAGHLCAALRQDEQFVVYLRAVISE